MKADLTRKTFDPLKHFSRVLMQQGRVQLDADWNEQAAILLRYLQVLAADLIGPQGGPAQNLGFVISQLTTGVPGTPIASDFRISLGHYYVDGILCEADSTPIPFVVPSTTNPSLVQVDSWTLDGVGLGKIQYVEVFDDYVPPATSGAFATTVVQITNPDPADRQLTLVAPPRLSGLPATSSPKLRRVITYLTQPDYPVSADQELSANQYVVYLDAWERLITYVQDDSIREVALGGPDTATRAKIVWQVKVVPGTPGNPAEDQSPCDLFTPGPPNFLAILRGAYRGRLKARAKQSSASTDPCIIAPQSRYTGPENQLYRVEMHTGGTAWNGTSSLPAGATFKWSRENGSVVFPITNIATGSGTTTVVVENLGRDDRFGLAEGEWVEVQDDDYVLLNRAAPLLQVQSIDTTTLTVTLTGAADPNVVQNFTNNGLAKHPLVRRWDQTAGDPAEGGLQLGSDNAALILEGSGTNNWLDLEDGVQIQFQVPDAGQPSTLYRTGDYWLIPARTATGDVEWPTETTPDSSGKLVSVPIARPPDGVTHHYAPLALITVDGKGNVSVTSPSCQKQFSALA